MYLPVCLSLCLQGNLTHLPCTHIPYPSDTLVRTIRRHLMARMVITSSFTLDKKRGLERGSWFWDDDASRVSSFPSSSMHFIHALKSLFPSRSHDLLSGMSPFPSSRSCTPFDPFMHIMFVCLFLDSLSPPSRLLHYLVSLSPSFFEIACIT